MEFPVKFDDCVAYFLAASAALPILHPLDVLKTRFQVSDDVCGAANYSRYGYNRSISYIIRREGKKAFYKGFFPSLLRESMYTPLRFSLFFPLYNVMHTYSPVVYMLPSVYVGSTNELISAFIAGGTAAMMSLGSAITKRGLHHAYKMSVLRGAIMNSCYFSNFVHLYRLKDKPTSPPWSTYTYISTILFNSIIGGFYTTAFLAPFDILCIRMMKNYPILMEEYDPMFHNIYRSPPPIAGPRPPKSLKVFYSSYLDCYMHLLMWSEDHRALYLGGFSMWARYSIMYALHYTLYDGLRKYCDDSASTISRHIETSMNYIQDL